MIFVTGGTGMLGAYIIHELLSDNKQVRALKRTTSNFGVIKRVFNFLSGEKGDALFAKIQWAEGDLNYYEDVKELLAGVDTIYHSAAMVSFNKADRKKMFDININGTATLVDAAIDCNIDSFCHISSIASLGTSENGDPVSEATERDDNDKLRSAYSQSKFLSEMEVWRGINEGLNAVIVNPSVILGVGDWNKSSAAMFGTIAKGMKFYTKGSTGFVDAYDVAKLSIQLVNKKVFGQRFVLSSENLGYRNVFSTIAKSINRKPPIYEAGKLLTSLAWRFEAIKSVLTGKSPAITRETASSALRNTTYTSQKVIDETGYRFKSVASSIEQIGKEYLKNNSTF